MAPTCRYDPFTGTSREEPSPPRIHVSTVGLGKCHCPLKPPSGCCGIRTCGSKSQPDLPGSEPVRKGGTSTTKPSVPAHQIYVDLCRRIVSRIKTPELRRMYGAPTRIRLGNHGVHMHCQHRRRTVEPSARAVTLCPSLTSRVKLLIGYCDVTGSQSVTPRLYGSMS